MFVKKKVFLGVIFLMLAAVSMAQNKSSDGFSWDNMRYGGRFTVSFANDVFSGTISPAVIYQFNEKIAAGATVSFGYTNFKDIDVDRYNYGGSILAIYTPIQQIQLSAELEQVCINENYKRINLDNDYSYQALHLGAGYRMNNVVLGFRYDVLYDESTNIYASPFSPFIQVFF